jgi:dTDP-4-amino-4,6-dideoxygalactose transaminase
MERIPVFKPLIEESEIDVSAAALKMGWLGMGKYVGDFEQAVKAYLNAPDRHMVAVSTGHAALHLGLLLAGVGPGDEVITPAFNNAADFQAILATGASPVFCDVEEETLCIDLENAARLVSSNTKALIVMDYDCFLCDHDKVARFAETHGLRVVHDAAHSFGSSYNGKKVGSFSDICMFSFDPVKTITCIDGGMLVVRAQEELEALHEMRLIGMSQPTSIMYQNQRAWTYDIKRLGFRYHLANLHAAIGLSQLSKIEWISETRRAAGRHYNERLSPVSKVKVPRTDFHEITPFLYYIRVPAENRDALRAHLSQAGIDTGIHWQPGHWFTLLKNCRRGDLPVTDRVGAEILSLPLHSGMPLPVVDRICDAIISFFNP